MSKPIRLLMLEMQPPAAAAIVRLLKPETGIAIAGVAGPRDDGLKMAERLCPDVVAAGIDAPFRAPQDIVKRIMIEQPTPIVLITDGRRTANVAISMAALQNGALTVISIPPEGEDYAAVFAQRRFVAALKAMSEIKLVRRWRDRPGPKPAQSDRTAAPPPALAGSRAIAIAASTGGPAALHRILSGLTASSIPPILIVQHIAEGYVGGLAQWLNDDSPLTVKTAHDGEMLRSGTAYLAPDRCHLTVTARGQIALNGDPPVDYFRPSADALFESAARVFGPGLTAIVLTGMGDDGVRGLRTVRQQGGRIIAQDEASAAVFGMPKAACDAGLVDQVLALQAIADGLASMAAVAA